MLLGLGFFTALLALLLRQGFKFGLLLVSQERFDRFIELVADDFGFRLLFRLGQRGECRVVALFCPGLGLRFHGGLKLGLLRFSQAQLFSHSIKALYWGHPLFLCRRIGGIGSAYRRYGGHSANDQGDD